MTAAVTLAACTAAPARSEDPVFNELIEQAIARATTEGASAQQVDLLESARASGELSLEQMRSAVHATVECMVDAGLGAEYIESTDPIGLTLPAYRVSTRGDFTSAEDLIISECDAHHNGWVNMVYQLQPSTTELHVAFVNSVADELRACLVEAGYQTDPEATGVELAQQAGSVSAETQSAVDCLAHVGAW